MRWSIQRNERHPLVREDNIDGKCGFEIFCAKCESHANEHGLTNGQSDMNKTVLTNGKNETRHATT